MYNNKFIASIKCNGKFLRETKNGEVFLPYSSEYNIYLKNINSRKALVSVSIDGEDILNDKKLIIEANSILDLDCFVDELNKNRKLKFIEKTKKISDYRGDFIEDGLIVVKFQYEKEKKEMPYITWTYQPNITYYSSPVYYNNNTYKPKRNNEIEITCDTMFSPSGLTCSNTNSICRSIVSNDFNEKGITVRGSESNQQFQYGDIGQLEDNIYTLVIQLKGCKSDGSEVKQVITTKSSKLCNICGTNNKGIANYCSDCGTYLN
jgi:hypothetical protein